jgi:hypothetical protein
MPGRTRGPLFNMYHSGGEDLYGNHATLMLTFADDLTPAVRERLRSRGAVGGPPRPAEHSFGREYTDKLAEIVLHGDKFKLHTFSAEREESRVTPPPSLRGYPCTVLPTPECPVLGSTVCPVLGGTAGGLGRVGRHSPLCLCTGHHRQTEAREPHSGHAANSGEAADVEVLRRVV